jgi:hypothetical protein
MSRGFVHRSYVPVVQNNGMYPRLLNLKIRELYFGGTFPGKPNIEVYSRISDKEGVCKKKCKFT